MEYLDFYKHLLNEAFLDKTRSKLSGLGTMAKNLGGVLGGGSTFKDPKEAEFNKRKELFLKRVKEIYKKHWGPVIPEAYTVKDLARGFKSGVKHAVSSVKGTAKGTLVGAIDKTAAASMIDREIKSFIKDIGKIYGVDEKKAASILKKKDSATYNWVQKAKKSVEKHLGVKSKTKTPSSEPFEPVTGTSSTVDSPLVPTASKPTPKTPIPSKPETSPSYKKNVGSAMGDVEKKVSDYGKKESVPVTSEKLDEVMDLFRKTTSSIPTFKNPPLSDSDMAMVKMTGAIGLDLALFPEDNLQISLRFKSSLLSEAAAGVDKILTERISVEEFTKPGKGETARNEIGGAIQRYLTSKTKTHLYSVIVGEEKANNPEFQKERHLESVAMDIPTAQTLFTQVIDKIFLFLKNVLPMLVASLKDKIDSGGTTISFDKSGNTYQRIAGISSSSPSP